MIGSYRDLPELAKLLAHLDPPANMAPRHVADGIVRLMILVAQDLASFNQTGRSVYMTEEDAKVVMYSILDGKTFI